MEALEVRAVRPEDWPDLERLYLAVPRPDSVFVDEESLSHQGVSRLKECILNPADWSDDRVLVLLRDGAPRAFMHFLLDDEHSVTHDLQTFILDFTAASFEELSTLLARARRIVEAFENKYLLVDLPPSDKRGQLWFYRCGFRAEQQRVVKRIDRGHRGAASPLYPLRKAQPEDLPFILEAHSAHSAAYRPGSRDIDLDALELHFQLSYMALDLGGPDCDHYFIMDDAASGRPAGYIFLNKGPVILSSESFYVYDVALAPEVEGRGLSQYLMGAAESVAGERGGILYGDGSLGKRSLPSWHEQIGFSVDTLRFALDCRPTGGEHHPPDPTLNGDANPTDEIVTIL